MGSQGSALGRPLVVLVALAVAFFAADCGKREPASVILITLDTTRADRLGCYGCEFAQTPNLDRFASEALVFESAVVSVPLTLPSHCTIHTGLYPPAHGVRNNASFRLDGRHETLAERLSTAGYRCAAFVSSAVLARAFGLDQGFSVYDDEGNDPERTCFETTRRAVQWLESESAAEPFFLWVHYFEPHTPWSAPEPFASQTRGEPYDAEVSAMAAGFGELLAAVRELGLDRRAHIIALGDHGEGLGDHKEIEHGIFLYEETLHVPLIWRLPGGPKSERIDALASSADIVPTVLAALDLGPGAACDGIPLAGVTGRRSDSVERQGVYAETLYPYYSYDWSPLYAWRETDLKYIEAPEPELYDLARDPQERSNLAEQRAASAERSRGQLEDYRTTRGWAETAPEEGTVDPRVAEQLTSLGYIVTSSRAKFAGGEVLPDPKSRISIHEHFERGKLAVQSERYAEAVDDLKITLAAYPDNHSATYFMGLSLVKSGRPAEALPWLEKHLQGAPEPNVTLLMGDALLDLGRPDEALIWYRRHMESGPQVARATERSGDALSDLKRYAEALDAYRRASETVDSPSMARKRARALIQLGRLAEAAAEFRAGAESATGESRGFFTERAQAADRLNTTGLTRPASDEVAFAEQVRAAATLGLTAEAGRLISAARGTYPAPLLQRLRGDVAFAAGDWREARNDYQQVEAQLAESSEFFLRLAKCWLELGDPEAARAVLERGLRNVTDDRSFLHYNLACLYSREGRVEDAVRSFAEAWASGRFSAAAVRADTDLAPLLTDPRVARLLADSSRADASTRN